MKCIRIVTLLVVNISLLGSRLVFAHTSNALLIPPSTTQSSVGSNVVKMRVLLTAYVPDGKKTATGRNANLPGLAAEFETIPKGTRVSIPGIGHSLPIDDTFAKKVRDADIQNNIAHIDLRIVPRSDKPEDREEARLRAIHIGKHWIYVELIFP